MPSAKRKAFGVYVHWPFCLSKCPYCDFNSHVRHAAIDEARFLRAFHTEIGTTAERVRGQLCEEALEILHLVWTEEHTSFDGRFWSFPELTVHPRPVS